MTHWFEDELDRRANRERRVLIATAIAAVAWIGLLTWLVLR